MKNPKKIVVKSLCFFNRISPKEISNSKPFKSKAIHVLVDCAERSSVHGCPSFASLNVAWPLKLIWLGFVLASWTYFGYQMEHSISSYLSFDVSTSSSILEETPTLFPAIDVCNINPINSLSLSQMNQSIQTVLRNANASLQTSYSLINYIDRAISVADVFSMYQSYYFGKNKYSFGFKLTDMLISCMYNGQNCSASDFYWYYDFFYGSCYRFNGGPSVTNDQNNSDYNYTSGPIIKAFKPGWRNGLRLELYTPYDLPYSYKSGFRVIVHNQSTPVYPDEDGIDVPTGFQTNLAISRTFLYRLPSPYSDCIDALDQKTAAGSLALQKVYQQIQSGLIWQYQSKYCFNICYLLYVNKMCGCTPVDYVYLQEVSVICQNSTQVTCSRQSYLEFYRGDQVDTCYSSCPQECSLTKYQVEATQAIYPTEWYQGFASSYGSSSAFRGTYDQSQKSVAHLNVFYNSLDINTIQESPAFPFDLLLANIGGNLGLFTGMSLLSFVELIELMIQLSIILIRKLKSK